ncbi:MAG: hypothetical protein GY866_19090 [Proteobacteria bacterium]|nr:hypothetical protein [Pseudomonadota bacterium]
MPTRRASGLAGMMTMFSGVVTALVLPQIVERFGWDVWMILAGCCCLVNIVCVSFAKGPYLKRNVAGEVLARVDAD